ncbi:hypothetical protein J8F10_10215 [Gemmata sp. G18]|uniref:Uncharacterized protein n=1 Tax=Gemmata palustris TaxID=2822762 RepID=A0ABS5BPQ3_9BACT|nr:hypothetical protein [Gemmata palustris]MBP3955654.1 hypothetical protein [Gemmata palustris]
MRTLLYCMLLAAFCGTTVADDKTDEKIDATKLVGVTDFFIFEFTKDARVFMSLVGDLGKAIYSTDGNK